MLWELFKHLKSTCPIYLESMTEDKNSAPKEYVVIEQSTYDEGSEYGDGQVLIRRKTFNIRIYTKTPVRAQNVLQKYIEVLDANKLSYKYFGPTRDDDEYATLIQGVYNYGKST